MATKDEVEIDGQTFVFRTDPVKPGEIPIGATAAESEANLNRFVEELFAPKEKTDGDES